MGFPVIAYKSFLRETTTVITDPGTETGFAIASIKDMKSYTLWKSNQTAAAINIDSDCGASTTQNGDYIALVNHNLFTLGATVRVLADTVSPAATQVLAATTPTEDTVTYLPFTAPTAKRYWRITINHSALPFAAKPYIGEIFLGMRTTCTEFATPVFDPYFRDVEVMGDRSEGGHFLAASLRGQIHRGTLELGGPAGVTRAFHDSDLTPFKQNHADPRYPFVFVLDPDDSAFKTPRYVKLPDSARIERKAVGGGWSGRLTFMMPLEEAMMEAA